MQPIVATPSMIPPAEAPASAAAPLPAADTAEGEPQADSFAGLPFAWFFAAAMQPAPAAVPTPELAPEGLDPEGTPDGNLLPVPATPLVALPPALPLVPAAQPAEGLDPRLLTAAAGGAGPVVLQRQVAAGAAPGAGLPSASLPGAPVAGVPADATRSAEAAEGAVPAVPAAVDPFPLEESGTPNADVDHEAMVLGAAPRHGPPAPGASARAEVATLPHPVGDSRWTPALAERLTWMVEGDVKHAELRLNPPELGPLEVRIAMVDDEARITFTASHPNVREALEAALPRLRDMLGSSGVHLLQVDVSGQGAGQRPPPEAPAGTSPPSHAAGRDGPREALTALGVDVRREGLFDAYA